MAINDKVGVKDDITLILNGKEIKREPKPKLICDKCGADRFTEPCRREGYLDCPIRGVVQ
jgi:hypothetical protein